MKPYIKKPHRRVGGLIPHAGSTGASTFVGRRINSVQRAEQFSRAAKAKTAPAIIAAIPESRWRFIPPHQERRSRQDVPLAVPITFRGRSGKLYSNAPTRPVGPGWREVGGYEAFPSFALLPQITAGAQLALGAREDRFGKRRQLVNIKALTAPLNRLLAIAGIPYIGARFIVWHVGRWSLIEMVAKTPLETGTAAAGWTISPQLRGKGKGYGRVGFRIGSDVEYIRYLEYGHQSYPPQFIMRGTFAQAKSELRNLMNVVIMWWKNEQILLRNLRFDAKIGAGIPYDEIEQKIPKMTWERLANLLEERLPLKDVSELNTSAALALLIRDPKDWHTVKNLPHRGDVFETSMVRVEKQRMVEDQFHITPDTPRAMGHPTVEPRLETYYEMQVEHVKGAVPRTVPYEPPAPKPIDIQSLEAEANALERIWRQGGVK